jgi:hypothetical protein
VPKLRPMAFRSAAAGAYKSEELSSSDDFDHIYATSIHHHTFVYLQRTIWMDDFLSKSSVSTCTCRVHAPRGPL